MSERTTRNRATNEALLNTQTTRPLYNISILGVRTCLNAVVTLGEVSMMPRCSSCSRSSTSKAASVTHSDMAVKVVKRTLWMYIRERKFDDELRFVLYLMCPNVFERLFTSQTNAPTTRRDSHLRSCPKSG